MTLKIVTCQIGPYPKTLGDQMPVVEVTFEDGTRKKLFEFYPDEIAFRESEFLGLTEDEALRLRHKRNVEYLQR